MAAHTTGTRLGHQGPTAQTPTTHQNPNTYPVFKGLTHDISGPIHETVEMTIDAHEAALELDSP